VHVDFTTADAVRTALAQLTAAGGLANIDVTGTGVQNDPWVITLTSYHVANRITIEYDLDAALMAANPAGTYQVIERRDDAGVWSVEKTADGRQAVYSSAENVASSDFYITPYRTIQREGPRLLEKDVFADLDGDGKVEKTGA